jgi:putative oxidoreductase
MPHINTYSTATTIEETKVTRNREKHYRALKPKLKKPTLPTHTDKVSIAVRTFLGLVFVISGLNGFMSFLPEFSVTGDGASFIDALVNSYFWPVLKVAELVIGGALLFNVFSEFAVFLLAPVTLGILWFHVFLSPPGAWFAWSLFAAQVALVVFFRKRLKKVFFPTNKTDDGKLVHDDNLNRPPDESATNN